MSLKNKTHDHPKFDLNESFKEELGGITQKYSQNISQSYLDELKDIRNESKNQREGEFMRVASIPVAIINQWRLEGFDYAEHTGQEIIQRLNAQDLGAFMTTEKKI